MLKKKRPRKALGQKKNKFNKKRVGKKGEDIAVSFLAEKDYQIIDRNFQKGYGEIDIIALSKDKNEEVLVFVEVKTRRSDKYGPPATAITPQKIKALKRSIYYYKLLHPQLPQLLRLDLVTVDLNPDNSVKNIEHFKNISA